MMQLMYVEMYIYMYVIKVFLILLIFFNVVEITRFYL